MFEVTLVLHRPLLEAVQTPVVGQLEISIEDSDDEVFPPQRAE